MADYDFRTQNGGSQTVNTFIKCEGAPPILSPLQFAVHFFKKGSYASNRIS